MRAIWLLNTIEVELSHLGIPLMRVPLTLRDLGEIFARGTMSEQDRQLIEDEENSRLAWPKSSLYFVNNLRH